MRIVKRSLSRVLRAAGVLVVLAALCLAYARYVEPTWLRVRRITLSAVPTVRVIHVSDIHFSGDTQYLEKVVATINAASADLVCFTGDLVEEEAFLDGALRILAKVNKPLYGVPGNHDRWAIRSFERVHRAFEETGGAWVSERVLVLPSNRVAFVTLAGRLDPTPPGCKRILLEHYPAAVVTTRDVRFDLALAGHTHGRQIRIRALQRFVLPYALDPRDRGLFETPCGPLHVSPGIGTYSLKMRFRCRPEVTLIEL